MFAWIARLLPGMGPALGALMNPWIIVAIGGAVVGAFLYGLHLGNSRLDAFESAVAAEGRAAQRIRAAQVKVYKGITASAEAAHELEVKNLNTRIATLDKRLRDHARRRIVPAVPGTPEGGKAGAVCYDREALNAGLQRVLGSFLQRTAGTVAKGDKARADFLTCAKWAIDQKAASALVPTE